MSRTGNIFFLFGFFHARTQEAAWQYVELKRTKTIPPCPTIICETPTCPTKHEDFCPRCFPSPIIGITQHEVLQGFVRTAWMGLPPSSKNLNSTATLYATVFVTAPAESRIWSTSSMSDHIRLHQIRKSRIW